MGHQEYSIQVDEILLAVGRALHNWSRVEEAIVDVLWRCMETRTSEPARIVWDSINITPSRLKMLQEMVSFAARDDQANALWAELGDAFLKHEMIRRDLAQYQLVRFGDGPRLARASRRASASDIDDETELVHPLPELFSLSHAGTIYSAPDVNHAARSFIELRENLNWFGEWVLEFKRIPHEYATPPPSIVAAFLSKASREG